MPWNLPDLVVSTTERRRKFIQGRAKREASKVTEPNLRFPAVSAKIFGFLRKPAVFCALQMLECPGEGVNLRKSVVFCENLSFGLSLSP